MNIQKLAVPALLVSLLSLGLSSSMAWSKDYSSADKNTARINDIINGLVPKHHKGHRSKSYRKRVYKVRPRYKKKSYGSPVIVNFNRSVNLSIFFAHDKADITRRARHVLDDLGYALRSPRLKNSVYLLAGHTNAKGAAGHNQWLSEERAYAAKEYLVRHFNINPNRLVTTGFGEERLLNRRHKYSSVNRRVEIALIEKDASEDSSGADAHNRIIMQENH